MIGLMGLTMNDVKYDALEIAERFFAAIEQGDIPTLRSLYAPEALIWHNYDPIESRFDTLGGRAVDSNILLLGALQQLISGINYDLWYQDRTSEGFVRHHVVRGQTQNGGVVAIPVCVTAKISSGRITHLYEYLDANHLPEEIIAYFAEQAEVPKIN
ncbi:MAG: ketosteroid isomerase-like protein [Marinomonas primoryensis]|jgi:ketosteroid isomerase-like protein